MTLRKIPIITNEIYHIFNKGIAGQRIFTSSFDYQRFIDLMDYYRYYLPNLRFSFYNRLAKDKKQEYYEEMKTKKPPQIQIFAYCLMPNHYHIAVKELIENGIRKFISNLQNSYAKYFNTRNNRNGSLFTEMFKNVRIESEEQFVHLTRYVHLNPITSFIIRKPEELDNYKWSSFPYYLKGFPSNLLEKNFLLSLFKNVMDFETFTKDQIDYQRKIHELKYLTLEN